MSSDITPHGLPSPIRRRAPDEPRLVSFAQQRLWFLDRLAPGDPYYNEPLLALVVSGEFDQGAMRRAFAEIVRRHETLRSVFPSPGGEPQVCVRPPAPVPVRVVDLSALPAAAAAAEVERLGRHEGERCFDLQHGPLVRLTLLRRGPCDHVLFVALHHIVSDGWSLRVLLDELSVLYGAFARGRESPLPDLPVQYADYAAWQRERLRPPYLDRLLQYWTEHLADLPREIGLPADYGRSRTPTHAGRSHGRALDPALTRGLRTLARDAGATLYHVLLAAFEVLLCRYSGQTEFALGTPLAGRDSPAIERLIGFFVNTLVVRADLRGNPPFLELVSRVREETLANLAHGDLPFDLLVDALRPARDRSRNPLFNVMFAHHNFAIRAYDDAGLSLRRLDLPDEQAKFDLVLLTVEEGESDLDARLIYSTDLFAADTIASMWTRFEHLLQAIVSAPHARVADLSPHATPARPAAGRSALGLAPEPRPAVTLTSLVDRQAARVPDALAIVDGDRHVTYAGLCARARALADRLSSCGVGPEAIVALLLERSADAIVTILGIMEAGAAYLPLDPAHPADRIQYMIADAGTAVIVTTRQHAEVAAATGRPCIVLDDETRPAARGRRCAPPRDGDLLAYVAYTSGTTGRPKGSAVHHRAIANFVEWGGELFRLEPGRSVGQVANLCFDASVAEIFMALGSGATLILFDPLRSSPSDLMDDIVRSGVSLLTVVPSLLHVLDPDRLPALPSPTTIVSVGEVCPVPLAVRWSARCRFGNAFGPSETAVCSHVWLPDDVVSPSLPTIPIGREIRGARTQVVTAALEPAADDELGELLIGGVGTGRGYVNRPALTAERFLPDAAGPPGSRVYRTGDVVRRRADGIFQYAGRSDDQMKVRGFRVEAQDVEHVLRQHPDVAQAAVVAADADGGGGALAAFLVERSSTERPDVDADCVAEWQQSLDQFGRGASAPAGSAFDVAGWVSAYTGRVIPADDMAAWLAATTDRIERLQPRRILEIGCGRGPIALRLAPQCDEYWATDFSPASLDAFRARLRQDAALASIVRLFEQPADRFDTLRACAADVVVLNSVVQYFPSRRYLLTVLAGAIALTRDGGAIYLGDVRHLALLPALQLSIAIDRARPDLSVDALEQRIAETVDRERELALSPEFFFALPEQYPRISHVRVEPRLRRGPRELADFRYDVTLYVGGARRATAVPTWIDAGAGTVSLDTIEGVLARDAPDVLGVSAIPNRRLAAERRLLAAMRSAERPATVGDLRAIAGHAGGGLEPDDLVALERRLPYAVDVSWRGDAGDGSFQAIFSRRDEASGAPWHAFRRTSTSAPLSNDPARRRREARLADEAQALLRTQLPDYMVPQSFTVLRELPLNASGKTDRRALRARGAAARRVAAPPSTSAFVSDLLALFWTSVLRVDRVGPADNFFEQGGHSLLATQLVARVNDAWTLNLPVRAVFETPVFADLVRVVDEARRGGAAPSIPVTRQPRDAGDIHASLAQRRLWFFEQLAPRLAFYNVPSAIRLIGPLRPWALERALNDVCRRHDSLRTRVVSVRGEPMLAIDPEPGLVLGCADLEILPEPARAAVVDRLAREAAARPFAIDRERLVRAALLRISATEHVLLLTVHHLVCDGWSIGLLLRELSALYQAALQGTTAADLPELPVQYADYAVWQRRVWSGERAAQELAYWRQQLSGCPNLALPYDRPRPPVQTYRGATEVVRLPQALVRQLDAVGGREGTTLFMTLAAAFAILLHQYSGQEDACIGTPIANRDQVGIENLIGFFANTLALRLNLSGDPRVADLLTRIRRVALDAYDHRTVPFEDVVRVLQPERDLSRPPVFQVWFALLGINLADGDSPSLRLEPVEVRGETAKFDLSLSMVQVRDGLIGNWEYNVDLFERATIRRMAAHFGRIVDAMANAPDRRISQLPVLDDEERRRQVIEWNDTAVHEALHVTVDQWVAHEAAGHPDRVAVVCGDRTLTYEALEREVSRLAARLRGVGVATESLVGICVDRSIEMVTAVLAVLRARAAFVALDPALPEARLQAIAADAGLRVVIVRGGVPAAWRGEAPTPTPTLVDASVRGGGAAVTAPRAMDPQQLAYVMYTSGTSGMPKAVQIPHGALTNLVAAMRDVIDFTDRDRWLAVTPLSFDISILELLLPLVSGGAVVMAPADVVSDSDRLGALIERAEATVMQATPSLWRLLTESGWAGRRGLALLSGGEALATEHARSLARRGRSLVNVYGPTETTIWSSCHRVHAVELGGATAATIPIGRPLRNTRCYIVDRRGNPVPVGVVGELHVAGSGVARGYRGRPDETAARFVPDALGGRRGDRAYRTGDQARYRADGTIEYLGRRDGQVKIRGVRIEVAEVEATLAGHPSVREVAVVAVRARGEMLLHACIVPADGASIASADLQQHLRERLPEQMLPARWSVVPALPLTPNGKLDRRALAASVAQLAPPPPDAAAAPPRTATESVLADICADLFEQARVGVFDDFFTTLGAHSLTATRLTAQIRTTLDVDVPVRWIFETRTIAALAARIDELKSAATVRDLQPASEVI